MHLLFMSSNFICDFKIVTKASRHGNVSRRTNDERPVPVTHGQKYRFTGTLYQLLILHVLQLLASN
jgi:hypothetical protein